MYCEEVCVSCFKVFRSVRDFLRHADYHPDACERKVSYVRKTCDELRKVSDKQLDLAIEESQTKRAEGGKRMRESSDLGSETEGPQANVKRARPNTYEAPETNILGLDRGISTAGDDPTRPPVPTTTQIPTTMLRNTDAISDSYSGISLANTLHDPMTLGAQTDGSDLNDFDAPILQIMNGVPNVPC